jgi:hypothetical protein
MICLKISSALALSAAARASLATFARHMAFSPTRTSHNIKTTPATLKTT